MHGSDLDLEMFPWRSLFDDAMGSKGEGKGDELVHNPLFQGATWLDL